MGSTYKLHPHSSLFSKKQSVLFGILRPGDVMLSLTGQPYDTLEEVIGIRGGGKGSLKDFDIEYKLSLIHI